MSAILKISAQKQKSALTHTDPLDHLILNMFLARSPFDLAVLIHAYQTIAGKPVEVPVGAHPMWSRALDVLKAVDTVPGEIVSEYVTRGLDGAPSTRTTTDWGSFLPMSDKARSDAAKERQEKGVYHGIRRQRERDPRPYQEHPVTKFLLSVQ